MKAPRASFYFVTLLLGACIAAAMPRAVADTEADKELLASGSWKITYEKGWSIVRVFDKGGTFGTPGRPDESGKWKMAGNMVVQTFADGRKDILTLPLNPKGTAGIAKDGGTLMAVHDDGMPPAIEKAGADMDQRDKEVAAETLVAAPWKFTAGTWSTVRAFDRSGNFSTQGSTERGKWKIAEGMVTLAFEDGHKDFMILPLDPKGTAAALETGEPATAVREYVSPLDAGSGLPPSSLGETSIPIATPTPRPAAPVALDQDAREASAALLISGPWKISGAGWSAVRVFDKNGAFTTVAHGDSHGRWRMTGTSVVLSFADGHKDVLQLPLDAKGSTGVDAYGGAMTAVLVSPAAASTPAPVAPAVMAHPGAAPGADTAPKDPTIATLVAAPWRLTAKGAGEMRVFAADGTFTTPGRADESGKWTMTKDLIILSFPNGHKDALSLPLDPKGTTGMADDGSTLTGVQVAPAATGAVAPAPAPAPAPGTAPFGAAKPD